MECFSRVDSPDGSKSGSVPCATLSQNSENLSAFRQPERWLATKGGSAQALDHMRAERTDQPRSREGGRADVSALLNRCFVVAGSGQGPPQEKLVQAAPARKPIATRQVDVQLGEIGGGDHRAPPMERQRLGICANMWSTIWSAYASQAAICIVNRIKVPGVASLALLFGRYQVVKRLLGVNVSAGEMPGLAPLVAVVALSARWLHLRRLTSDRRKLEDSAIW